MPTELDLSLRLLLAAALGGAIGLERELSDQPAGFRTHILVSLGACLFAVLSAYGFGSFVGDEVPEATRFDPSRVAAQIVSGIGFLGAGAIIRYGMTVRGLTTAASLWVVAAIGMAAALAAYTTALVTTGITLLALFGLRGLRTRMVRGLRREHEEFLLEAGPELRLEALIGALADRGIGVQHVRVDEDEQGDTRTVDLHLKLPPGDGGEAVVELLTRADGVRNVDWTR
jgi:putative Mg2+ transporter-C (MgtC) family protein